MTIVTDGRKVDPKAVIDGVKDLDISEILIIATINGEKKEIYAACSSGDDVALSLFAEFKKRLDRGDYSA